MFLTLKKIHLICTLKCEKCIARNQKRCNLSLTIQFVNNINHYNTQKKMKFLGISMIVIGALALVLSMVVPAIADMADENWYTWGSVLLIIIGLISHIIISKKLSEN